jgi:Domain of unknown function (DUF4326)
MTTPQRVQQHRAKGWRKPDGAISVARPHKWGNPFAVGEHGVCTATNAADLTGCGYPIGSSGVGTIGLSEQFALTNLIISWTETVSPKSSTAGGKPASTSS